MNNTLENFIKNTLSKTIQKKLLKNLKKENLSIKNIISIEHADNNLYLFVDKQPLSHIEKFGRCKYKGNKFFLKIRK